MGSIGVAVHFHRVSDAEMGSCYSYRRRDPKSVLAFSAQAACKTHYSKYATHRGSSSASLCSSLLLYIQKAISVVEQNSHAAGNENSITAGPVSAIFRQGIRSPPACQMSAE